MWSVTYREASADFELHSSSSGRSFIVTYRDVETIDFPPFTILINMAALAGRVFLSDDDMTNIITATHKLVMARAVDRVSPEDGCPICHETAVDRLVWQDDDRVRCGACGAIYTPFVDSSQNN